ncbi:MAG: DUF4235 domain-containing protein [Solirubrobacterales bacterium]
MTDSTSASKQNLPAPMHNDLVQKLMWSGLMALASAVAAIAARKAAEQVWTRVFGQGPPID